MMMKIANFIKNLKKDDKGFTLIELMVVVAVLGILASLIIPQFTNVKDKAEQANADATANAVASAAAIVYAMDSSKPTVSAAENQIEAELEGYLSNIGDIQDKYVVVVTSNSVKLELKENTNIKSEKKFR